MISVPQPSRVAIGYAMINGQKVDVFINQEWARYFLSMTTQVIETSTTVNSVASNGVVGMIPDDNALDLEFIPGPPGKDGAQGPAGPAIFLLEDAAPEDVFWPAKNT